MKKCCEDVLRPLFDGIVPVRSQYALIGMDCHDDYGTFLYIGIRIVT